MKIKKGGYWGNRLATKTIKTGPRKVYKEHANKPQAHTKTLDKTTTKKPYKNAKPYDISAELLNRNTC